ncbi:hypothetical protein ACFSNO_19030 [Streptomyces cirratus]
MVHYRALFRSCSVTRRPMTCRIATRRSAGPTTRAALTTESIAHPGSDERSTAVYPVRRRATVPRAQASASARKRTPAGGGSGRDETREDEFRTGGRGGHDGRRHPGGHRRGGRHHGRAAAGGPRRGGVPQALGEIQGRFVDDPQEAVRSADTLVAEVMQTLAGTFSSHKQELEGQWSKGEEPVTEDLRIALQRYRSFFNRLLHT